jgi:hypothetical protein
MLGQMVLERLIDLGVILDRRMCSICPGCAQSLNMRVVCGFRIMMYTSTGLSGSSGMRTCVLCFTLTRFCIRYSVENSEFIKLVVHDAYDYSIWYQTRGCDFLRVFVSAVPPLSAVQRFPSFLPDGMMLFSSHFSETKLD